jgi:hypothetical protein
VISRDLPLPILITYLVSVHSLLYFYRQSFDVHLLESLARGNQ